VKLRRDYTVVFIRDAAGDICDDRDGYHLREPIARRMESNAEDPPNAMLKWKLDAMRRDLSRAAARDRMAAN